LQAIAETRTSLASPAVAINAGMNGSEACSQLEDVGWNLTDSRSIRFAYPLRDGTRRRPFCADRAVEASRRPEPPSPPPRPFVTPPTRDECLTSADGRGQSFKRTAK